MSEVNTDGCTNSHTPPPHTQTLRNALTHTPIHRLGVCLTRLTDVAARFQLFSTLLLRWVGRRLALMIHTHTHVLTHTHSFAHSLPQLSHRLSVTQWIYVLCTDTHKHSSISACVCVCVCERDGDVFTIWRNVQYLVM